MKKRIIALTMAAMMICATGVTVFAAEQEIKGSGEIYIQEDLESQIKIEIPSNFKWTVTETSAPNVQSAQYEIINNSEKLNLQVKLKSFEQTNATVLPGILDLRLEGDLGADDVKEKNILELDEEVIYSSILNAQQKLTYKFGGTYVGDIPATALKPEYTMLLNFGIDSAVSELPDGESLD